jgi:pantoate--beta-alanine ligase
MFANSNAFTQSLRQAKSTVELQNIADSLGFSKAIVGFVPTMGALHGGHLQLVNTAKGKCDFVVVSIFVNPTQFNNPADYEKYPRDVEKDLLMLKEANVDVVFLPSEQDIYPNFTESLTFNFGLLDSVLEGQFRPGHFNGVGTVVSRLFEKVKPNIAFFGEKDLQQVAVVKNVTNNYFPEIEIFVVPTKRAESGLALSSRNLLLSEQGLEKAAIIYEALLAAKSLVSFLPPEKVLNATKQKLSAVLGLSIEYVEIVDGLSFTKVNAWQDSPQPYMCIACFIEDVRLIDNMRLID